MELWDDAISDYLNVDNNVPEEIKELLKHVYREEVVLAYRDVDEESLRSTVRSVCQHAKEIFSGKPLETSDLAPEKVSQVRNFLDTEAGQKIQRELSVCYATNIYLSVGRRTLTQSLKEQSVNTHGQ